MLSSVRTTTIKAIGKNPFMLMYGFEDVVLVQLAINTYKLTTF